MNRAGIKRLSVRVLQAFTPLGGEVLARYRGMDAKALDCLADDLSAFAKLMR